MTISTVKIDPRVLPINWQTNTTYTIVVGDDFVREVGNNRTPSPVRTATISTFAFGPEVASMVPAYATTGSTSTLVSITYNREINLTTATTASNYYLFNTIGTNTSLVSTIPYTSTRVTKVLNTVTIDLYGLVNSNGNYHIRSDANMFDDMFRFPSVAIVNDQVVKYSTAKGPEVVSVDPPLNSAGRSENTGTLVYNRLQSTIGNKKYYLYETTGTTTNMILEIDSTGTRVSVEGQTVKVDLTDVIKGNHTYHLQADQGMFKDQYLFDSEPINDNGVFKYTITTPPAITQTVPTFNSTGSFVSTASIRFNRIVNPTKNNFYLYNNSGVFRTFSATSSSIYKSTSTSTQIEITLWDQPMPEGEYHIRYDLNAIKDSNGIPADAVTNNSVLKWTNKSLNDFDEGLSYNSRIANNIFSNNKLNVLDRSPNSSNPYTLTLTATSGTFSSNVGTTIGNTWTYTATVAQINAISSFTFNATNKNLNWDLPFTARLSRNGVTVASRSNTLIGLPYDLDSFTLVSSSLTNIISSATTLTASANTTTVFNGTASGLVTFRSDTQVYGTSTFVNSTATITLPKGAIPVGTHNIVAEWQGQTIVPKFNGRNSDNIIQTILPLSTTTLTLLSSPSPYYYHRATGSSYDIYHTATVTIRGMSYGQKPTGSLKLFYGGNLITTQALPTIAANTTTTSTTITWQPWQDTTLSSTPRSLQVVYDGDDWNTSATVSTNLLADVKRNPGTMVLTPENSILLYNTNYSLRATMPDSSLNGKTVRFNINNTAMGTSPVIGNTATFSFQPIPATYSTGTYTFSAFFDEDFNYYGASDTVTNTISKVPGLFQGAFYPGEDRRDPFMDPGFPHEYNTSTTLRAWITTPVSEFNNSSVYVRWWLLYNVNPPTGGSYQEVIELSTATFVNNSSTVIVNLGTLPRTNVLSRPGSPEEKIYNIYATIQGVDGVTYEVLPPTSVFGVSTTPPRTESFNFNRAFFVSL